MIGDREAFHTQLTGTFYERIKPAESIEHGVFGVRVKVSEHVDRLSMGVRVCEPWTTLIRGAIKRNCSIGWGWISPADRGKFGD
jgi:hypothetical protein